jgi:Ni/Co efflux regulator RcnB
MKKILLTLFAVTLACSPLLAESTVGKTPTTHSQISGKTAKQKKHHKKKKKKAHKAAKKAKSAAKTAEAA